MKTITKIGIGFLAFGFLLYVGLIFLLLMFAVGGGPGVPPIPSPLGELVMFGIELGTFWFLFVILGVILIIVGVFQRRKDN